MSNVNLIHCNNCKQMMLKSFKYCCHCGHEISPDTTTMLALCTSFNDLDFNLITKVTAFLHSSFEPLVFIENVHKIKSEKVDLYTLFSLNKHYRKYKAKNYCFRLNSVYSKKFYYNENNFCLNMQIDDTSKQLMLDLEQAYIVDVSILPMYMESI